MSRDIDPRNYADSPGTPLVDVETTITLRTLCGCSRTFKHGNRASLGTMWTVPLFESTPRCLDVDSAPPIRTRSFRFHHFEDRNHWVYEEVER